VSIKSWAFEISFEESIVIKSSVENVFKFAADAINDERWRTEVHSINSDGPFATGTVYIEDAFLGFHYNYITKVELKKIEYPTLAFYETTQDNPYKLRSLRLFESIKDNSTKFTYRVYVEEDLIFDILFEGIPLQIAEQGYRSLMRSYLKKLKHILEKP
jgi:hypothetical protein